MSEGKVLSFDDLVSDEDMDFEIVKTKRGDVKIGTLNSADILEWMEDNNDPVRGKFSGLRMLVLSMVGPDGKRIGEGLSKEERRAAQDAALERLKRRDSLENGKIVRRCLELNGLRKRAEIEKNLGNDSGEARTDASPSDLPSPPVG